MAEKQLIIFCDLDGTLLDVSPRHYKVYCETVEQFGGKALDKNAYWDLKRAKAKWPMLLEKSRLADTPVNDFLKPFIEKIEDPDYLKADKLFPGSLEALELLHISGDVVLVSLRRNRHALLQQLGWLGIDNYFKTILTGHSESDGYDEKIKLISMVLGDRKGVIIGDTEADVITGKTLGLTTVAVTSGIRNQEFLQALRPDYIFSSITQLDIFNEKQEQGLKQQ